MFPCQNGPRACPAPAYARPVRAALITGFGEPLVVTEVEDPVPSPDGVVIRVEATGVCRSDWHAWMGHEQLPSLPHVPGHEMAGTVAAIGSGIRGWTVGDRVTVPFSIGCGTCVTCRSGHLNTCDRPFTPGFTHWGSFAELVAIDHAELNLVRLPDSLDPVAAAGLGCRVVTAYRAVVDRGRIEEGQWLAVFGCGGVGLSAVMIASALGARVVAVDIDREKLARAIELGAEVTIDISDTETPHRLIRELTGGGAHVGIDALGSIATAQASIRSLRKQGRHVQAGLLLGDDARLELLMEPIIMRELEILGTRGLPATDYPRVLGLVESGAIDPSRLVERTVPIEGASAALEDLTAFRGVGVTVIDRF